MRGGEFVVMTDLRKGVQMAGRGQEEQTVKVEQGSDIITILASLSRGNFIVDAGRKCWELAEAIVDVRAKGKLVITLDIEPGGFAKDGRVNQVVIRPEVKITKPVPSNSTLVSLLAQKYPYGLPPRKPDHIKASVNLTDAESFCKYVALYQDARTRVFAGPQAHSFQAVLDYHGASNTPTPFIPIDDAAGTGAAAGPATPSPEFMDHRVSLTLRTSEQWNLWIAKDGKEIPQADFAEFLEDNYRDIFEPSPAVMLEVARDLSAKSEVNFSSKVTAKSGAVQLTYNEIVNAAVGPTGEMEVPNLFTILIPVFFGESPVKIEARLRFRINGGKLKFVYKLYRPAELLATAFEAAARGIGEELHTEVLLGSI